jgi:hypothetical protein
MRLVFSVTLSICLALAAAIPPDAQPEASASATSTLSTYIDIIGPPGSGQFGKSVTALPNGNIVVTDPYYDSAMATDVGAVYLYDGATGALISTITGSTAGDQVGYSVTALTNGNYIVYSPYWDNGVVANAGAVTWCSGTAGCTGTVSAANSLVGTTAGDQVGQYGVIELSNGNYVVSSRDWDNGGIANAGAVTWCSGTAGCTGTVSAANSLVGTTAGDQVGYYLFELSNGNYVARSWLWDNGAVADAGAATWCSGVAGCTGPVTSANSLVGSTAGDQVGSDVTELNNGNYVVSSRDWDNGSTTDAGAATWCSGTAGCTGTVSAANSLVGSTADDQVGSYVVALTNGHYVVSSRDWDNGGTTDAGAVTWGDGTVGITGTVSTANSLVGSTASDEVGRVTALTNSNYVVSSRDWDNGSTANAGAVTWCSGVGGCTGTVSAANSLVGSSADDMVGNGITALTNGHYVVRSPSWDNGAVTDVGAVTWGDGTTGITGTVSAANSLVGSTVSDRVGDYVFPLSDGNYVVTSSSWDNGAVANTGAVTWCSGAAGCTGLVTPANSLVGSTADDCIGDYYKMRILSDGDYVVVSPSWDNGAATDAGAVTWCSGTTGCTGPVTPANSLVGSTADDRIGYDVVELSNGDYVVRSSWWDSGGVANAGAVTWGNGTTGITGTVSAANSLIGSTVDDHVGSSSVAALSNGHYAFCSPYWDNGSTTDTGAVSWCIGPTSCIGPISAENSVHGTATGGGGSLVFAEDPANFQLVVGRPADNVVTLFRPYARVFLPLVLR